MLATYAQSWFVSAVPTLLAFVMAAATTFRNMGVLRELGGEIRSFDELELLRPAIDLSMILAIVYLAMGALFVGALVACVTLTDMSIDLAALHLGIFGVVTIGPSLWARTKEKALRKLEVTAQDPDVEATYRTWLVMWNQPRLRLPR